MDGQAQGIGGTPDHGGGVDAAAALHGGVRGDWLDLSTGINPCAYRLPHLEPDGWTALPDVAATMALADAGRTFWQVPQGAAVMAAPGASSLIARLPMLAPPEQVAIPAPTYNEHAGAFAMCGRNVVQGGTMTARVVVNPNNPDGRIWTALQTAEGLAHGGLAIIDESFADTCPEATLMGMADQPGTIMLKSFGKFWGLVGLRLGFAIGDPVLIARLSGMLGPWPVSGPALSIGTAALTDTGWTTATRDRLGRDAQRLDALMAALGAQPLGGTDLFRLFDTQDANTWQTRLAARQIWTRVFPYNTRWLRLGLPGSPQDWAQLEAAL